MRNLLFTVLLLTVTACGSNIKTQARAVAFTRSALDVAAESIEVVCDPAAVLAADNPAEWRDACVAAIEGHDTTRALWAVWRNAFISAVASDDSEALDVAWSLVGPILNAYGELVEFLAELGVTVPSLPFGEN